MASRFWATSEDMSVESSTDLSVDRIDSVPRDGSSGKRGVEEVEDSLGNDSSTYTLARTMATSLSLPDRQTQEHASLLHLSLMGGRCRTQAANTVNARRRSCEQDSLPEDDSEICELSEHMFSEMKRELLKLGLISPELASKRLSDLSLYLTSFDALLNNIATRTNHDISIQQDFRSIDGSDYTISRDLSASTNPSRALVLRRESNIDRAMAEVPIDPSLFSLLCLKGNANTYPQSLYDQNYEQLCELGKGGEGSVFKAKYTLDEAEYAVKRIIIPAKKLEKLRDSESFRSKLKEVYALAKFDHPNVVRYHHSWVEFHKAGYNIPVSGEDSSDESETESVSVSEAIAESRPFQSLSVEATTNDVLEAEISSDIFGLQDITKELADLEIDQNQNESGDFIRFADSDDPSIEDTQSKKVKVIQQYHPVKVNVDAVIFIKMTAYPFTLQQYLNPGERDPMSVRHCFHILPTIRFLLAVVDGLQYIHRRNIVHKDLKPANIFLSILPARDPPTQAYIDIKDCTHCANFKSAAPVWLSPHIGDFGMIHEVETAKFTDSTIISQDGQDSEGYSTLKNEEASQPYQDGDSWAGGTQLYAPPRIRGVKEIICPKRDSYALGAIALEMICSFNTGSERYFTFNKLREEGKFPTGVENHELGKAIMGMLQSDREQRWGLDRVKDFLIDVEKTLR